MHIILWNSNYQQDIITYTCILKACAVAGTGAALEIGQGIYQDSQLDSALLSMYSSCGAFDKALPWWKKVIAKGTTPPSGTLASALRAFAAMGPLGLVEGKAVHELIKSSLVQLDLGLYEALLDMYIRCGERNDGNGVKAISLFNKMPHLGIAPNSTTFVSLMNACSCRTSSWCFTYLFFPRKLWYVIYLMKMLPLIHHLGVAISLSHQSCVVDALGRAGKISDALAFIEEKNITAIVMWTSLLSACRIHVCLFNYFTCLLVANLMLQHNVPVAVIAAKKALQINPKEASIYLCSHWQSQGIIRCLWGDEEDWHQKNFWYDIRFYWRHFAYILYEQQVPPSKHKFCQNGRSYSCWVSQNKK